MRGTPPRRVRSTLPALGLTLGVLLSIAGSAPVLAQPPAVTPMADVGFPPPGAKWTIRTVTTDSTRTVTFTALEEGSQGGRPVYRATDGVDVLVYDKATRNWIARVRNGQERASAMPHGGAFSWPLSVGKQWRAIFRFADRVRGRSWDPVEATWEVEAFRSDTRRVRLGSGGRIHPARSDPQGGCGHAEAGRPGSPSLACPPRSLYSVLTLPRALPTI